MATLTLPNFTFQTSATPVDVTHLKECIAYVVEAFDTVNPAILSRTADTGQLSLPDIVTMPAANTVPHYVVYKFDDGVAAPFYIKVMFGRLAGAGTPIGFTYAVATGTNGAGGLTGYSVELPKHSIAIHPNYTSHSELCVLPGMIAAVFGSPVSPNPYATFGAVLIARTTTPNGTPDGRGVVLKSQRKDGSATASYCLSFMDGAFASFGSGEPADMCRVYNRTSFLVVGELQPLPVFSHVNYAAVLSCVAGVIRTDVPIGTEFSVAMAGATQRNYRNLGIAAPAAVDYAVLWE